MTLDLFLYNPCLFGFSNSKSEIAQIIGKVFNVSLSIFGLGSHILEECVDIGPFIGMRKLFIVVGIRKTEEFSKSRPTILRDTQITNAEKIFGG